MILYDTNYFGLLQLTIFTGSAVYRTILPSLLSTCVFFVYKYTIGEGNNAWDIKVGTDEARYTVHPFVITIYIMAFSLIINHRLNFSYQRYWESCSNIFMMTSKWMDSATALAAFHYQSVVYEDDRPRCFGDEDKPPDQLNDKDKKKSAPTGGNTRTAMVDDYIGDPEESDDENGNIFLNSATSASDTSDSGSSSSLLAPPQSLSSSFEAVAAPPITTSESRGSFVSPQSRERRRTYSDAENLSNTKRRFSGNSFPREAERMDSAPRTWFRMLKNINIDINIIRFRSQRSDVSESQSSIRDNSNGVDSNNGSSILKKSDLKGNALKSTGSNNATPPRDNLSKHTTNVRRRDMFQKSPSMPLVTRGVGAPKGMKRDGINKAESSRSLREADTNGTSAKSWGHRRVPSTDMPAGRTIVKSFKPNPSLDWQKRNRTAMPGNTGLHSTVYQTPFVFDYEQMLLKEEKERKKKWEAWKQRQHELQTSQASITRRGSAFARSIRSRVSLSTRSTISYANSVITAENPTRHNSDPTRSNSVSTSKPQRSSPKRSSMVASLPSKIIKDNVFLGNSQRSNILPNLRPRLELHDLPSLAEKNEVENSESGTSERDKSGKSELDTGFNALSFDGAHTRPFDSNTMDIPGTIRQSASLQPPVEKLNGRASLFLQEAAHLFSLMSAVAMASLRRDMEGVSSPLVDYVPGQKFPPVNPEEMQVKILVTEEEVEKDDGIDKTDKPERNPRVRVKRVNKLSSIVMFLFGTSQNSRERTIYNASRPFPVLGGISDAEVEMLRQVRGHSAQHALCSLWLREFITREHLNGSTGSVAPPIVARIYQHISDGTQQYNNCRRTAFTDFPFPHAQLTSFFGFVSIFIFPLLYYTYIDSTLIAVLLNVFSLSCFFGIQEVALELEDPFIRYPNDLPLNNYQAQFNEALISSLYGGFHPDAWGDTAGNGGFLGAGLGDGGDYGGDDSKIRKKSAASGRSSSNTGIHFSYPLAPDLQEESVLEQATL